VLTPLTYLGGIFYSIKMLPPVWQIISLLNPIIYIIDIFRYGILGISEMHISIALSILVFLNAGLIWLCLYLLKKGVGIRS
jgi:ABC-2 type transport system permease protein